MLELSRTKTSNQFPENVPKRLLMNTINETLSLGRLDPIETPGSRQSPEGVRDWQVAQSTITMPVSWIHVG